MSTANVMKEANEGWLVKVVGTVKDIKTTDGDNSLYIDDGSGVARVYVNGYIGDGTANAEMLGKWDASIAIGDYVSAIGLASQDAVGHRIRVRNTGEIIKLAKPVTHNDDGSGTVTAPSNPGPVNGVWTIAPTQQEVAAASASEMVSAAAGGAIKAQDGTSVVLPPNVIQSGTLNIKVGIGQVGQVPEADTITMFEPVLTQREFTANVSNFDAPVTISIPYKGVDLQGIDPSLLAIFWWNPDRQTWIKVGGIVDPVTQTISVPVYHFSTYAVMADQSAMAERLAGEDRFGTAIAVAEQGWPSGADTVILANAQAYADALAGTPLAFKLNAPILLTDAAGLTASTATELKKLRASKVVLLGGEGVIRSTVEAQLFNLGYSVTRYGGADRFGTAKVIADALGSRRQAVVVSGEDAHAVDALAIASWAAYHGAPILFTEKDSLPSQTQEFLNQGQPSLVYVVGGTAVVSDTVLKAVGGTRLAGADRYETATQTAASLGLNSDYIYVATGLDCVDALVAGNLAAKTNSPVLYVNDSVPTVLSDYVKANRSNIKGITIIGGAGVVKAELTNALKESLKH